MAKLLGPDPNNGIHLISKVEKGSTFSFIVLDKSPLELDEIVLDKSPNPSELDELDSHHEV